MKVLKNVGRLDRTLRIIVGSALALAGASLMRGHALVIGVGLAMLLVGLIGFCPIYVAFGISTRKRG